MDIITSHNALDFDGLASMVAANKLYPGATKVFSGTVSKNVKKFMALYKDLLLVKNPKDINPDLVKRMIIVDTASPNRLGRLKDLALSPDVEKHVYDHHPISDDDVEATIREVYMLGAATTILVEKIMEKDLEISAFDATILALGIYEDTGSLQFPSTTGRDARVVGYLLDKGANLSVVTEFMGSPFTAEQRLLLQVLLNNAKHYYIKNLDIVIATSNTDEFVPGLDVVTYRLFEVENSDAIFVVSLMEGKVNVVGRSRNHSIKVNEILQKVGGRGHEKAASAVVRNKTVEEVAYELVTIMEEVVNTGLIAADIMSSPVKTIPAIVSMEEAGRLMLRYGHTGMPVVDGEAMIGVISRRDVDKARIHNLGHAPVKGFMTSDVQYVKPSTPIVEIQRLMIEQDIGRLPVVEAGKLLGIVSRTDVLRTYHGDDYPEDHELLYSIEDATTYNFLNLMQEKLPSNIIDLLKSAGEIADEMGVSLYCVGGFVRDLILDVDNFDIDLVVEGDGEKLANLLAEKHGGKARIHERFGTAMVVLPDSFKLDIATARTEYYEFPAALPTVEKSSIREDLYRRDFTINTLAICLNKEKFGDILDYFGGQKDIEQKVIRILYNFSFVEDPTRIMRAIRFETRYGFTIEPDTLRFAKDAIERRLLGQLSYKRILQELILILNEQDPIPALQRMVEIGVWQYILPEVKLEEISLTKLKRVPVITAWYKERYLSVDMQVWLVYIMVILSKLPRETIDDIMERYHFDKYAQTAINEALLVPEIVELLENNINLSSSEMDKVLANWSKEGLVYLMLCISDEKTWENVVTYLDCKDKIEIETTGYDLKDLGIKQGPIYREILDLLYQHKLDGKISNKEEEINFVNKWLKENN